MSDFHEEPDAEPLACNATCIGCGYNLRGLQRDRDCPECGKAIEQSLHNDLLRRCDPAWIDRLALGATSLVVAVGGGLVLLGLAILSIAQSSFSSELAVVCILVLGAARLVGYWFVTTPSPGGEYALTRLKSRVVARCCLPVGVVAGTAAVMLLPRSYDDRISSVLMLVCLAAWLPGIAALFCYLRELALKVPNDRLAGQAKFVMWGYTMMLSLCLLMFVVAVATNRVGDESILVLAGIFGCCGSVCLVIVMLVGLSVLEGCRRAFNVEARAAHAIAATSSDST